MKPFILIASFLTLIFSAYSAEKYSLEWKLEPNEKQIYYMNQKGEKFDSTFSKLFESFGEVDSSKKGANYFQKISSVFKEMNTNERPVINILIGKDNGNIQMLSYMNLLNNKEVVDSSIFGNFFKKPMLNAEIDKRGQLKTFYLPPASKNLINMFFQLPTKPVSINDSWTIDVNYATINLSMTTDSIQQDNKATLLDVKEVDGETIAYISYSVNEYIHGDLSLPFGDAEPKTGFISVNLQSIAEFSITKGQILSYKGKAVIETKNMMMQSMSQTFGLERADDLPQEVLDLLKNQ